MISKMNKLSFLIYHKEYDAFLEKLRALGVVHVEIRQTGEVDERVQALLQKHASYRDLQREMSSLGALAEQPVAARSGRTIDQLVADYHEHQQALQELQKQLPLLDKEIAQMEIWGEFDWSLIAKLRENGWLVQFFACPDRSFEEEWVEAYHAIVIAKKMGQCFFVTVHPQPVELEAEVIRLPQQSLSEMQHQREALQQQIQQQKEELSRFCAAGLPVVEQALCDLTGEIDLLQVRLGGEKMADGSLVMLEGWVPVENDAEVRAMLDQSNVYYEERAAEKEDNAPIKLKNNRVTGWFETLTRMYGLPDYGEFDPTPLLAPFYALFFGLCLGDAGYGLFLVLFGFFLKTKVSKSMAGMMNLLITLGVAATVVGAVLGTFFGVDLLSIDIPQEWKRFMIGGKVEIGGKMYYQTMILALVVGMIHICFAMTVKAICSTARYGFKNSLADWGWLLMVGGSVSVATLNFLQVIPTDVATMAYYVIGGISAVGIFLLNDLHRNVFMNVGAGLWATYNMATGLLGDLLSYLRLYALGLAGGLLGGVFNDLGMQTQSGLSDFMWGIPGWIAGGLIFVFGHTLNIALSCLSAYVHSIRLTFVEYFKNSGYDGRGISYKPFSSLQNTETKK